MELDGQSSVFFNRNHDPVTHNNPREELFSFTPNYMTSWCRRKYTISSLTSLNVNNTLAVLAVCHNEVCQLSQAFRFPERAVPGFSQCF